MWPVLGALVLLLVLALLLVGEHVFERGRRRKARRMLPPRT